MTEKYNTKIFYRSMTYVVYGGQFKPTFIVTLEKMNIFRTRKIKMICLKTFTYMLLTPF